MAEGLVGIIQVQVILKLREWVCSHGPQLLQFILQCLEQGLQRLLGETLKSQIYLPTAGLPLLADFPPNAPLSSLIKRLFPLPLNTSRNSSSSLDPTFFHANCYQRPSRAVPTLSRSLCLTTALDRIVFFSSNSSSTRTLRKATGCTSPCLIHSLYGSELPLPPKGWHKARLFPQLAQSWKLSRESPLLLLPIIENQSSQQH